jgi:Icc protein
VSNPRIDVILATGDIAQDASEVAYTRFQQHLAQFNAPIIGCRVITILLSPFLNVLNNKSHLSPCVIKAWWLAHYYAQLQC